MNREKWISTDDDKETEIVSRKISPDRKRFIGIYQVLFGYRVRAGYIGKEYVEIDWCCGNDKIFIITTYNMLLDFLEKGGKFSELPSYSKIKPYHKDEEFIKKLGNALEKYE